MLYQTELRPDVWRKAEESNSKPLGSIGFQDRGRSSNDITFHVGAEGESRTRGPLITKQVLWPLSYIGEVVPSARFKLATPGLQSQCSIG